MTIYTSNELIADSYYASGVVSREFQTVSGSQFSDGLRWLNNILSEKRVDQGMIPYETPYHFIAKEGVQKYFIPNLIQIDTLVFFLQNVRYSMGYSKRNEYFGAPRVENIQSLPYEWYFERQVGGGNLYIYFAPDKNYPMEVHGTFNLNSVSLGQNLSQNISIADLGMPKFYGLGSFNPGQFVVNNVDLMGDYPNIGSLVNFINTGIIPGVSASINVNDFVLISATQPPVPIYVQTSGFTFTNGTNFIGNVAAATTSNLASTYNNGTLGMGATLTATSNIALVIDGYTVNLGDRVLVINQTNPAQNGSYSLTTLGTGSAEWVLTRTTNYNQSIQIAEGNLFTVLNGSVNAGLTYIQDAQVSVIGTSAILFSVFNALTFSNFSTIQTSLYEIFNPNGLDEFYTTYLQWALADRICAEYNYDTPMNVMRQLSKYQSWINKKSRLIDLRMKKVSTLGNRSGYNWAQINIGKGFTPS